MADILDPTLKKLSAWKQESENLRSKYDNRWSRNLKLLKGIFQDGETTKSSVRNRSKTFFRKIWATRWRLLASFYNSFLRDPDQFKIEGRDTFDDPRRAKVLQVMTEYRRDRMMREDNLFLKLLWGMINIIDFGWCAAKLRWDYNAESGVDKPTFMLYPNEQVFPDLAAETVDGMRYIHFLNYLTKDEIEEMGYKTDGLVVTSPDSNQLRNTRNMGHTDPLQNVSNYTNYAAGSGGHYPASGSVEGEEKDAFIKRYKIYESFWKEDGMIKYAIHNDFNKLLKHKFDKNPKPSPYGKKYPVITGTCLTEAHKLIGEGFPEPLEAPQESFNYNLNMRKDNVALAMTGHTFVSRYGNVDLQSLTNRRLGGYTIMDDVNAVKHEAMPDVTQSSYIEAQADMNMMEEMSGITDIKQGMSRDTKATIAQINYAESNAKIDLFIAIVGETYFREFYSLLTYFIQRFETDETIFAIANETLRRDGENPFHPLFDIYDLGFEADVIVNVGLGTVSRDMELKQTMLLMDRAIMSNRETAGMLQMGVLNPQNAVVFNVAKLMLDTMPKMGKKNFKDYLIQLQPPPMPPEAMGAGGGQGGAAMAGRMQPQIGNMGMPAEANMIQAGGMGG